MNTHMTSPTPSFPTDFFVVDDEFDFIDIQNSVDGVLCETITLSCNEQRSDT